MAFDKGQYGDGHHNNRPHDQSWETPMHLFLPKVHKPFNLTVLFYVVIVICTENMYVRQGKARQGSDSLKRGS